MTGTAFPDIAADQETSFPSDSFAARPVRPQGRERFIPFFILLLVLGWISSGYTLFDVSRYSVLLLYIAAIPICLFASSRAFAFFLLPALSTLFSFSIALLKGLPLVSILSQTMLQSLALFFVAGVASLDWQKFLPVLTRMLSIIALPLIAFAGYQMLARPHGWKYGFLPVTNQQAYAFAGIQRGWEKEHFTRASSVFVEPSDLGYFCLWLLALSFTVGKGKWRYVGLATAFSGILFSQSLSAVLGVGIFMLVHLFTHPISVKLVRQIAIIVLFSGMAITAIEPLMPDAFEAFFDRVEQAVTLDRRADSGRVDHLPACWAIFKEAPVWGQGLASLNSADANGSDVTSIGYALLLMERGTVGTLFFLAPWVYLAFKAYKMPTNSSARAPALFLSALNLYCFATFSLIYFLPFWLALGITASLVLGTHRPGYRLMLSQRRFDTDPVIA